MARQPREPEPEEPEDGVEDEEIGTDTLDALSSRTRLGTPRRWIPVLPFWGVLLRGRDAPTLRPRQAPTYHPSVGYARDVYVAISMNWLVDVAGLTWFFHGYLVSLEPAWIPWVVSVALAVTFSSAFATFAISMVRKPIQDPKLRFFPTLLTGLLLLAAVAGFGATLWAPPELAGYEDLVEYGSIGALVLGLATFLFSTWGFQDGSMVFTRASVMFAVGYLVATPLHEAMFFQEILEEYRKQEVAEVSDLRAAKEAELEQTREEGFATCMRKRGLDPDPDCTVAVRRLGQAELLVSAIEFVKDEELRGKDPQATRGYLMDKAKELDATAVVALIGTGSTGLRGRGPRYNQAVKLEPEARRAIAEAKAYEERCREAVGACETEAAQLPAVTAIQGEIAELDARSEAVASGTDQPGVLDRTAALEAIVAGEGEDADAEERSVWMASRLAAAWFLAMVMPIIVLVMKLTAGDKLEPYLRKRWAGR